MDPNCLFLVVPWVRYLFLQYRIVSFSFCNLLFRRQGLGIFGQRFAPHCVGTRGAADPIPFPFSRWQHPPPSTVWLPCKTLTGLPSASGPSGEVHAAADWLSYDIIILPVKLASCGKLAPPSPSSAPKKLADPPPPRTRPVECSCS